jgi:hypothetical protein
MNLKILTMKTNHNMLGEVEVEGDSFILKQPVQVVSVPPRAANDPGGIAFVPFLEYSEEFKTGIRILQTDVLCVTTPVRDLENQYNQIFGAGIEITNVMPR